MALNFRRIKSWKKALKGFGDSKNTHSVLYIVMGTSVTDLNRDFHDLGTVIKILLDFEYQSYYHEVTRGQPIKENLSKKDIPHR